MQVGRPGSFILSLILSVGLHAGAAAPAATAEAPTVTWGFSSSEPITENLRQRLMTDQHPLFQLLRENLPEYRHEYFYGTVSRIESELKTKPRTCFAASTGLETRQAFTYQTAISVAPSPLLVTRKDIAEKYQTKEHRISAETLVKDSGLDGIFVLGRAYGPKLDKILNGQDSRVKHRVMVPVGANTIRMVAGKRADFTVEYDFVIQALKDTHEFGGDLVALPISDGAGGVPMYVACSKTPEGLAVVKKVDEIVRKHISESKYRDAIIYKAGSDAQNTDYEKEVDQFIRARKKAPDIHE
jgi:uncharacterized protein (TIGR02285 family)